MEAVLNSGTGSLVRKMGFTAPAAGKTGTSNDAWFAGYTSNLICIVWVGNDDDSDIKLQGAFAAAPIWAEFMKRAVALPQYSDTKDFVPPAGVSTVTLDKATNLLADASCPDDYTATFLDGTQPINTCDQPGNDQRNIFQKIFGIGQAPAATQQQPLPNAQQPAAAPLQQQAPAQSAQGQTQPQQPNQEPQQQPKKPGFFGRLFGHKSKDIPQQEQ